MLINRGDVICAVKDYQDLLSAIDSQCNTIFLLKSNINTVAMWIELCKKANKKVFIHIDLGEGLGKDNAGIEYIAKVLKPDGILSTKINVVKTASDYGLCAIYRVFLIDLQSMQSAIVNIKKFRPFAIEIMPGIAYEAISDLANSTDIPIIAGGFVKTKQSVEHALEAGAIACSTSTKELWNINN